MNHINPLEQIVEFLKSANELKVASELLKTFEKYSNTLDQYDTLARLFHDVKDFPSSLRNAEKALASAKTPQELYTIRSNIAKVSNHLNLPEKALQYINANLTINPDDYESKMEKVFSLYLAGKSEQSKTLTKELLNDPNAPKTVRERSLYNYGSYLLDDDNFQEGLKHFIGVGHDIGIWPKVTFPGPEWDGTITPNKNIAILAEGGIGDEIINVRFLKKIKELGMNPYFITNRKELVNLFNRNGFKTVSDKFSVPEDSEFCLSMFLPILLNISPEELWDSPYLTANSQYIEKWKKILPKNIKKVAIRWQGNVYYEQQLHRSVPLAVLNDKLDFSRADILFVSVQKDDIIGLENYPKIFNAEPYLETLEDLLACLSLMDYTISSCTSVAHVAAAAGYPITVLSPLATYYVWLGSAKWYGDNCTVLRQYKYKDFSHLDVIKL